MIHFNAGIWHADHSQCKTNAASGRVGIVISVKTLFAAVLLALSLAAVPLAGCSSGDQTAPAQAQDEPVEACPDTLLTGDSITFSNDLDAYGRPLDSATVFSVDTAEIFCTFTLSGDICCTNVIVMWHYGDEVVHYWNEDGTGMPQTNTVSFDRPEDGFPKGDYLVKVFVGIRETISGTFTVE